MAAIFIRTFIIYVFLSVCMKLMGKRQIGELEMSELVATLLMSEIAAIPVADPDIPLMNAIIPGLFIVCLEIIISAMKNKSEKMKRFIEGDPIFLIYNGEIRQKALMDNRISINELLSEIRMKGIGNIRRVSYAILEQNGQISVFERDNKDFSQPIVIDSRPNAEALSLIGRDTQWLDERLKIYGTELNDIFLMTVDENDDIYIIRKEENNEGI